MNTIQIEKSWKQKLSGEFGKPYFRELRAFIHDEYTRGKVYPHPRDMFRAFDLCAFDEVNVVILGQDPYHEEGQANGLCFAVNGGVNLPPSLRNIYKEIISDIGCLKFGGGDLEGWAKQGVLLLNATLTVRAREAGSHQGKGWEKFTDAAVKALSEEREGIVFMLWGKYAKEKGKNIDWARHLVLETAHPSPLSAHNGFLGCKHFSQANEYLKERGEEPIRW
jgi:uracil-DNA glycosylase